jgi:dTDP-4-dehydrorhamnose 3,5-epimerase
MDNIKRIEGVIVTPLNIIDNPNGDIYHIIRNFDMGFVGFGEVYISTVNYKAVKAWKKHLKMTSNFVVPFGTVKVVIYDDRKGSSTFGVVNEFVLSRNDYFRLTIPPTLWYGFTGLNRGENMLLNFADISHNSTEQISSNGIDIGISYNWN